MKITKTQLKQIIKEELGRVMSEGRSSGFEFEGTETKIEFIGMKTDKDQTETKLRINGEEFQTRGGYDIGTLADEIISELEEDDEYWFLVKPLDSLGLAFRTKLEETLEAIGVNPEGEDKPRTSYRDRDTGGTY